MSKSLFTNVSFDKTIYFILKKAYDQKLIEIKSPL